MNVAKSGYRVFSANSTPACTELSKKITERLGVELGKSVVYQESNRETRVEIKESVRGQTIFIIQTIPRDVNTAIMELLIMAYALKTSCAKNIIGVIPYFPYSKQCKMRKRGSIVCKLLASMLAKAGKYDFRSVKGLNNTLSFKATCRRCTRLQFCLTPNSHRLHYKP
nr:phosphoribosyl pyrophosphate synthase-associated protein 1-like [Danio rerio]|eukprot:XP_021327587.1 phosphoribosyl pyrophosphate synthase-associated protein 1-like [Danio rerio]